MASRPVPLHRLSHRCPPSLVPPFPAPPLALLLLIHAHGFSSHPAEPAVSRPLQIPPLLGSPLVPSATPRPLLVPPLCPARRLSRSYSFPRTNTCDAPACLVARPAARPAPPYPRLLSRCFGSPRGLYATRMSTARRNGLPRCLRATRLRRGATSFFTACSRSGVNGTARRLSQRFEAGRQRRSATAFPAALPLRGGDDAARRLSRLLSRSGGSGVT